MPNSALIIGLLIASLITFLFSFICYRVWVLLFYSRFEPVKSPIKPHFTDNQRTIVLDDGYRLACQTADYAKSAYLVVGIHGFGRSKADFNWFIKTNQPAATPHSYVFVDQRNFGANQPTRYFSLDRIVMDYQQIIQLLKTHYKTKKIILLGHSLGTAIITKLLADPITNKLIAGSVLYGVVTKSALNPVSYLKFSFKDWIKLLFGILCFSNQVITFSPRDQGLKHISSKKIYLETLTNLRRVRVPFYFYVQTFHWLKRMSHELKTISPTPLLVLRLGKDHLSDNNSFNKVLKRLVSHQPLLKIESLPELAHVFHHDLSQSQQVRTRINQWLLATNFKANAE